MSILDRLRNAESGVFGGCLLIKFTGDNIMSTDPNLHALQYEATRKSVGIAYLLWFFFGTLGGHRFYMKKTGSAVTMLIITLVSIPLTFIFVGFIGIAATAMWALVDAFLIPGWISSHNLAIVHSMSRENNGGG